MEVQLTDDQRAFVESAIASGRIHDETDALREALLLWEDRERRRMELLVAVDDAEASLAKGEGTVIASREELVAPIGELRRRGNETSSLHLIRGSRNLPDLLIE